MDGTFLFVAAEDSGHKLLVESGGKAFFIHLIQSQVGLCCVSRYCAFTHGDVLPQSQRSTLVAIQLMFPIISM